MKKRKLLKLSILRSSLGYCSCKGCKADPVLKLFVFPVNFPEREIYFFPGKQMLFCDLHSMQLEEDLFEAKVRLI